MEHWQLKYKQVEFVDEKNGKVKGIKLQEIQKL